MPPKLQQPSNPPRPRFHALGLTALLTAALLGGCSAPHDATKANAGGNRTAVVGAHVLLDGTKSTGSGLRFSWAVRDANGLAINVDQKDTAKASFTPTFAGNYVATLVVADSANGQDRASVTIVVTDEKPIADAGSDRSVMTGSFVSLDGKASHDAGGVPLTYHWTLLPPANSHATIEMSDMELTGFTADVVGTYLVTLVVDDGTLASAPAAVAITAAQGNTAPVANAGSDRKVQRNDIVVLDGSQSSDADGNKLTWHWTLQTPITSRAGLDDANAVAPKFQADLVGTYVATLVVNDGTDDSAAASVRITVIDRSVAVITAPKTAFVGDTVPLSGANSSNTALGTVEYDWTLTPPAGSAAQLGDPHAVTPSFTADVAGSYVVSLVLKVGDDYGESAQATIIASPYQKPAASFQLQPMSCIDGTCTAITLNAMPPRVGDVLQLTASTTPIPEGKTATYHWTVRDPSGADVAVLPVVPGDLSKVQFDVGVVGDYTMMLVVNDGISDSTATIHVVTTHAADAAAPVADAGSDRTVEAGRTVLLSGAKSHDDDDTTLLYQWTTTSTPPGSHPSVRKNGTNGLSFYPDLPGAYVFTLQVSDGRKWSAPASVTITATAAPVTPSVDLTANDPNVHTNWPKQLSAKVSESTPTAFTYAWSVKSEPVSGAGTFSDATSAQPIFTASQDGTYTLELTVTDANGASTTADLQQYSGNAAYFEWTVDAGHVNVPVQASAASGAKVVTYDWAVSGVTVTFSDAHSATFTFIAEAAGTATITLTVHDDQGHSATFSRDQQFN